MAYLKSFWRRPFPPAFFHQAKRYLTPPIAAHYEAIVRGEQEVPQYFNFAGDVVDKWSQQEKDGKNMAFWWVNGQSKEVKWSFQDLSVLSRKAANVLTGACGLQRGDRFMVILPQIPEWWLLYLACIRTGIIFIPGIAQLTAKDIFYRLQASKAKGIVVSDTLALSVDSVASEFKFLKIKLLVSDRGRDGWLNFNNLFQTASADHNCAETKSDDPMVIYFTSGTTGKPKMVEHSHSSFGIGLTVTGRELMDLRPSVVFWNTSDPGWVKTAWAAFFAPWIHGACSFVRYLPQFEPGIVLKTLEKYPINAFCTAPTAYRMLIQHNLASYKFMSLKHCVTGGEALNPEVFNQWKSQTGLDIHEGYGQTETVAICYSAKRMKLKPGSMGKAAPPYDVQAIEDLGVSSGETWGWRRTSQVLHGAVQLAGPTPVLPSPIGDAGIPSETHNSITYLLCRLHLRASQGSEVKTTEHIVDDQDNILPPGEEGDVGIRVKPKRPFCLFTRYIDNPEKTAATERGSFYITGDRGVKDEEGYIRFVGRADDVINSAGYRIGPSEVENALIEHPAVVESAVVSSPDPTRGEVVKAFVVLAPAFSSHDPQKLIKELQDHVKNSTAPYKYPRKVEFVQELPKTVTGKILRSILRKQEWRKL